MSMYLSFPQCDLHYSNLLAPSPASRTQAAAHARETTDKSFRSFHLNSEAGMSAMEPPLISLCIPLTHTHNNYAYEVDYGLGRLRGRGRKYEKEERGTTPILSTQQCQGPISDSHLLNSCYRVKQLKYHTSRSKRDYLLGAN